MKLSYCENCNRVFGTEEVCPYCNGAGHALKKDAPVNVIGTKIKGRVLRSTNNDSVAIIIRTEDNSKVLKEYSPQNLRKII